MLKRTFGNWLASAALALLCGCGGDRASAPAVQHTGAPAAPSYSLSELLAEVEATPMPGVAPDVADGLRKSLSRALVASGQTRFTSEIAVTGVDDLIVTNNGDGTATAHWTYRNTGDLDQNSEVNVSDLSALGANLGKNSSAADWAQVEPIDADANGEVNISDISTLGANLLRRIDGYVLQVSQDGGETWGDVQPVPFSASELPDGGGRRVFNHVIVDASYGAKYQLAAGADGSGGKCSNQSWFRDPPPAPQNFVASDGLLEGAVHCTWDSADDADSYTLWRADVSGGEASEIGTTTDLIYTDTTAALDVVYYYHVKANNTGGSTASNEDSGYQNGNDRMEFSLVEPPAVGDGSIVNPYIVHAGDSYQWRMMVGLEDKADDPAMAYSTSDPAHVTFVGSIMSIATGVDADFTVQGYYNGIPTNVIHFHIDYYLLDVNIMPDRADLDWDGVLGVDDADGGTDGNPFVMHTDTFNPDSDFDGIYDLEFDLKAVDTDGNVIASELLTWGCFPPFVALDINDASPGTFHVNQFSNGYILAQDLAMNTSNSLFVEVNLDQN